MISKLDLQKREWVRIEIDYDESCKVTCSSEGVEKSQTIYPASWIKKGIDQAIVDVALAMLQKIHDEAAIDPERPSSLQIGEIGNTDGSLFVKHDGEKYFWCISTYKEPDWEEIPKSLFDELMRHRESLLP